MTTETPHHFTLTSSAFKDGEWIALKHGGNIKQFVNCIGDNVSPPLAWSNPPPDTKSFALIMFDPEGMGGLGLVHWVAYGIPATVSGFAEGEVSQPCDKFVAGKTELGLPHYVGPCAPPGAPHHYVFTLIATDLEPGALPPGLTLDELRAALKGHSKGATGLVGLYARR